MILKVCRHREICSFCEYVSLLINTRKSENYLDFEMLYNSCKIILKFKNFRPLYSMRQYYAIILVKHKNECRKSRIKEHAHPSIGMYLIIFWILSCFVFNTFVWINWKKRLIEAKSENTNKLSRFLLKTSLRFGDFLNTESYSLFLTVGAINSG